MCLRGEVLQPLELEFRIVTGVLGSEPRSSARWVPALTRLLPSPLPETVMQDLVSWESVKSRAEAW